MGSGGGIDTCAKRRYGEQRHATATTRKQQNLQMARNRTNIQQQEHEATRKGRQTKNKQMKESHEEWCLPYHEISPPSCARTTLAWLDHASPGSSVSACFFPFEGLWTRRIPCISSVIQKTAFREAQPKRKMALGEPSRAE